MAGKQGPTQVEFAVAAADGGLARQQRPTDAANSQLLGRERSTSDSDCLRSEPTFRHLTTDDNVDKKSRPPPLAIPQQVVLPSVGLSPYDNLTPLDVPTVPTDHLKIVNSPAGDMPLLSPFGGVAPPSTVGKGVLPTPLTAATTTTIFPATPATINQDTAKGPNAAPSAAATNTTAKDGAAPSDAPAGNGNGDAAGATADAQPGSARGAGAPGTARGKEWAAFGDRLEEMDCEDAEEHVAFLTDSVMRGQEAAAASLHRRRQSMKSCFTLFSPTGTGGVWGAAAAAVGGHAELMADDVAGTFQVHCFAPGCSTPVMISGYPSGVEACIATEQINMMIECNPMLLSSAYGMPSYLGPHGQFVNGRYDVMGMTPLSMRGSPRDMMMGAAGGSTTKSNRGGRRGRGAADKGRTSLYLGVEWDDRRNGWAAFVEEGSRRRQSWLSRVFTSEEEAARARDRELVRRNRNTTERLNFPHDAMLFAASNLDMDDDEEEWDQGMMMEGRGGRRTSLPGGAGQGLLGVGGLVVAARSSGGKRGTPPDANDVGGSKRSRGLYGYKEEGGSGGARKGSVPTSKYRGVVWDESHDRWRAQLLESGSKKVLGYFDSQEDAARAYDMAVVRENRKEKTNFPPTMYKEGNHLTLTKGVRGSPAVKVTSQYKGVSWNSACSKWVAVLWDRELKRARHIGSFESEEAAARAYDREAIKMLGADAGLNFRESLDEYVRTTGVELRLAEPGQGTGGKGSSQYRGVSWHERSQRWEVRVWGGGKQHFIGSFTDEVDAARAYDKAVLRLRGQDARSRSRMNFPLSDYNLEELAQEPLPLGILAGVGSGGRGGDVMGYAMSAGGAYDDKPARRTARQSKRRQDEDMTSDALTEEEEEEDEDVSLDGGNTWGSGGQGRLRNTPQRAGITRRPHVDSPGSPVPSDVHMGGGDMAVGQLQQRFEGHIKAEELASMGASGLVHGGVGEMQMQGMGGGMMGQEGGSGMAGQGSQDIEVEGGVGGVGGASVGLQSNPQFLTLISVLQSAAEINPPAAVIQTMPSGGLAPQPSTLMLSQSSSGALPDEVVGDGGRRGRGLSRKAALGVAAVTAAVAAAEVAPTERSPRGYHSSSGTGGGAGGSGVSGGNGFGMTSGSGSRGAGGGLTAPAPVPQGTRGKSQYRGVSWCEKVKKWRALLWDGTKQRFLGHYVTDLDAARAYDRALIDLKGPDAKTNFPATSYDNEQGYDDGVRRPASSQYKGVSYNKSLSRWESRLRYNGRTYVVGSYATETEAARAHDCASLHLRGPAANFPAERYPEDEMMDAARRIEHAIAGGGEVADYYDCDGSVDETGARRSGRRSKTNEGLSMQVGMCLVGGVAGAINPVVQQAQMDALLNVQGLSSSIPMLGPNGQLNFPTTTTTTGRGTLSRKNSNNNNAALDPSSTGSAYPAGLLGNPGLGGMNLLPPPGGKGQLGGGVYGGDKQQLVVGSYESDSVQPRDQYSSDFPVPDGGLLLSWGAHRLRGSTGMVTGPGGQPQTGPDGQLQLVASVTAVDEGMLSHAPGEEHMGTDLFKAPTPRGSLNGAVTAGGVQGVTDPSMSSVPDGLQFMDPMSTGAAGAGQMGPPFMWPPSRQGSLPLDPSVLGTPLPPGLPLPGIPPHRWSSGGLSSRMSDGGASMGAPTPRTSLGGGPVSRMSEGGLISQLLTVAGPPSLGRGRSQFRGVSWHVVNNKYIARIRTNSGGNTHLGCFDSAHEAAQAYDVAAIALRGPHQAITNFPAAQYLTEQGTLRTELLDILSKASTPITPVATAINGPFKRRSTSARTSTSGGGAPPSTTPTPTPPNNTMGSQQQEHQQSAGPSQMKEPLQVQQPLQLPASALMDALHAQLQQVQQRLAERAANALAGVETAPVGDGMAGLAVEVVEAVEAVEVPDVPASADVVGMGSGAGGADEAQ